MGRDSARGVTPLLLPLLCLALGAVGQDCQGEDPCPGLRPRNPQGCCPARAGEACGEDAGQECDALLGYRCLDEDGREGRGVCKGPYGLKLVAVGQKSLGLDWKDFLPGGYESEYSLLYRAHAYTDSLTSWANITCGDVSEYRLAQLVPGTWYFVKIGVFSGPYNTTYANLSETLMAKTKAVEYCEHVGRRYEVGETFDNECEDRCTCLETGDFRCQPLCPDHQAVRVPEGRPDCRLQRGPDCCLILHCPGSEEGCQANGTEWEHGAEWEEECRVCQCLNGAVDCTYIAECYTPERSSACPNPTATPAPGQCCPKWVCGRSCEHEGVLRESGAQWEQLERCQTCTCDDGAVTCRELCPEPEQPANCSRPLRRRLPGSCCHVIECLPPVKSCLHNNQSIHRGNYFTNEACELCLCTVNGSVECSLHCAPLPLPAPSPICPSPTFRKQGCCDTLWCDDPAQDVIATIRNLFATSFGPHSLTLSFQVATADDAERGDNSIYEMLYAEESAALRWERVTVRGRPQDDEGETALRPAQLLQTTGVLRVADRVYVTLSGMRADTTYYVKIRPLEAAGSESQDAAGQDDSSATTSATPNYAGAVVVKTLANDTTCVHEGQEYREGETFSSTCGQDCTCLAGSVQCTCKADKVVMVPSPSCPQPRLEAVPDSCCPKWVCHPEENGCRYKTYLLRDGEEVRVGCQEVCHCAGAKVTCSPLCSAPGPAPRAACELRNLSAQCCPVWMCPPERKSPVAVRVTLRLGVSGTCSTWNQSAALSFQHAFRQRWSDVICTERDVKAICDAADVIVRCPSLSAPIATRWRRQADFGVDVTLSMSLTENREADEALKELARELADRLLASNMTLQLAAVTYTVTSADVDATTYVCEQNYIAFNNTCMPVLVSKPPSASVEPHNVTLTTLVLGPNHVTLTWRLHVLDNQVTSALLEFREMSCPIWNQTETFPLNVTRYTLRGLSTNTVYQARLVLEYSPLSRQPSQPITFHTLPSQDVLVVDVRLRELSVGSSSVTLRWAELDDAHQTLTMTLTFGRSDQPADVTSSRKLRPGDAQCVLEGLSPDTLYWARLHLAFRNGTTARSGLLHFLTRPTVSHNALVVPLAVAVAVVVCAALVVMATCCLWRRARRKESLDTAFENKVFGIQIQNEGRTLSART